MDTKVVTRAFIENEEGAVMLGKRTKGAGAKQWALIGGKPNEGEELSETVVREVKEETGLDFEPLYIGKIIDASFDADSPWHVYLFKGKATGELNLDLDEILEIIYVTKADIDGLDIAFNHKDLLLEFFGES